MDATAREKGLACAVRNLRSIRPPLAWFFWGECPGDAPASAQRPAPGMAPETAQKMEIEMRKRLRITPANAGKIEALLATTNGRAKTHTYVGYSGIEFCAERSEKKLEGLGIPKKLRVEARCLWTSGGAIPKAYKWSRRVTTLVLHRRATGWFLEGFWRGEEWGDSPGAELTLTPEQWESAKKALRKEYGISAGLEVLRPRVRRQQIT